MCLWRSGRNLIYGDRTRATPEALLNLTFRVLTTSTAIMRYSADVPLGGLAMKLTTFIQTPHPVGCRACYVLFGIFYEFNYSGDSVLNLCTLIDLHGKLG